MKCTFFFPFHTIFIFVLSGALGKAIAQSGVKKHTTKIANKSSNGESMPISSESASVAVTGNIGSVPVMSAIGSFR